MPRLPDPRGGKRLKIKHQPVDFSLWPVRKTSRRYGLQPRAFVSNPWAIIRHTIRSMCNNNSRAAAMAFCDQADDYYKAANVSGIVAVKPVLLYYCFLNLAKSFSIVRNIRQDYDNRAYHGLEDDSTLPKNLNSSLLIAHPTTTTKTNVFDEFLKALNNGGGLTTRFPYQVKFIIPQILQGHRLWCLASNDRERFIPIHKIELMQSAVDKALWLNIFIFADELSAKNISHRQLIDQTSINFREVKCDEEHNGRKLLCYEQNDTIVYRDRPSDEVLSVIDSVRPHIWSSVLSLPPYRKYFLYLSPPAERDHRLPQLASMCALLFYFGSVTRYHPNEFTKMATGVYGPFINEVIETVPNQFVYMMASEFSNQEISRASIL